MSPVPWVPGSSGVTTPSKSRTLSRGGQYSQGASEATEALPAPAQASLDETVSHYKVEGPRRHPMGIHRSNTPCLRTDIEDPRS
jgi:hypothetical protein